MTSITTVLPENVSLHVTTSLITNMSTQYFEESTASLTSDSNGHYDTEGNLDFRDYGQNENDTVSRSSNNYTFYGEQEYTEYFYEAFAFERPIYLVIWEILVIVTALVNVLVIIVLLHKKMRTPTNLILAAIAISDTLTGLVTLPTYIMVYQNFVKADYPANIYEDEYTGMMNMSSYDTMPEALDAYSLSKSLCTWFMLTKFFFSKLFHTCSIFLTLFLGLQRFVSVAYPFFAGKIFTGKTVLITCVCIFILSPLIHIYHLFKTKAKAGLCQWEVDDCKTDCAYLWIVFLLRHFIPCTLLSIFTILFIFELRKTKLVGGNREQIARREAENRRITIIVVSIVIVFLVPEIPYGVFLMMSVIYKHTHTPFHLETNRATHAAYELSLVVSFHANFYIYTFLNKRFRSGLKRTVLYPIHGAMGMPYSRSISSGTASGRSESRKTAQSSLVSRSGFLLRTMNTNYAGKEANQISQTDSVDNTETKLTNGSHCCDSVDN